MDTPMARDFWKIAGGFPAEKEKVYLDHASAHAFDEQARPCTDGFPKRVLEYGCGGGSDTRSLVSRGATVIFTDIVPENVHATQRSLADVTPNRVLGVVLEQSDVLPFDDSCFDSVNCHGVLHHIEEVTMDRVIGEFRRVLRPGGVLYAMLYTEHLFERCGPAMDKLVKAHGWSRDRAFGYLTDGGNDKSWCIARAYTERGGRDLFERLGFVVESAVEYNNGDFRTLSCRRPFEATLRSALRELTPEEKESL